MEKKRKKKNNKWMKFRHRIVRNIAFAIIYPLSKIKYGIKIEKFREQGDRNYLILYNHQTAFDQFFVGMPFKGPVYYLASEDIFSNGLISSAIRWLVAPIPIKKQTTDVRAILNCIKVAKEGGTIAIAPEGNRTYSGKTEYMSPAIASLAKKIRLPIALCRIEGGYGVQPRWSDVVRKGGMRTYVAEVLEPETYADMTDEELARYIENALYVNEARADERFISSKKAEYLERAMYVCHQCGFSHFESHGDSIRCCTCNREVRYGEDKRLLGVGFDFPFEFVNDWYEYQKDFVNSYDINENVSVPLFCDTASVFKVIINKKKIRLKKDSSVKLYSNRVVIDEGSENEMDLPFDVVSAVSVLGKNKLNIYCNDSVYQLKGSKRFNALKYVNFYYRYKNVTGGNKDGKFLGL